MTFYMMSIVIIFVLSVIVYEIFAIKICSTLTLIFRMDQRSNVNMAVGSPNMTSYLMAIVLLALSLAIYEIFANQVQC